ncbi:uncharacterized protein LOC124449567 [Xenia sp. Carnegie-2017]|uniref:uncharacterized protein LOC124449567 n=1 Tax=Xenia sp. Carnegie-2017 TaxID=2897299 RepID=UPI001F04C501|nr:uncharacterized protein LOC124449567 [Xenia sp. Carnegie-2017]
MVSKDSFVLYAVFFVFRAGAETVEDFTSLYLKELGYDEFYIGLIPLFGLVTQLTGVPICGYLADKFQMLKFILILSVLINIPTVLMYVIPREINLPCKKTTQKDESKLFYNKTQAEFINRSLNLKEYTNASNYMTLNNLTDYKDAWSDGSGLRLWYFVFLCFLSGIFELCRRLAVGLVTVAAVNYANNNKFKFTCCFGCGTIGAGLTICTVSIAAGYFKYTRCAVETPSFSIAFPVAAALHCFMLFGVMWLKFDYEEKTEKVYLSEAIRTLMKREHILILCIGLHVGACDGFFSRWQYWYLLKIGASTTFMGVERLLKRLILGAFWYLATSQVLNRLGKHITMTLSLLSFAVSFAFLALMENPWLVVFVDNFEYPGYTLFFTAAVFHFSNSESESLFAHIQGMLSLIINGIGKDVGSMLTGYLFKECGIRITLYGYSVVSLVWCIVLVVYTLKSQEAHHYERVEIEKGMELKNTKEIAKQ